MKKKETLSRTEYQIMCAMDGTIRQIQAELENTWGEALPSGTLFTTLRRLIQAGFAKKKRIGRKGHLFYITQPGHAVVRNMMDFYDKMANLRYHS